MVAYGYKNDGASKADILVLDPGVGASQKTQKEGLFHTLEDAEYHNRDKDKNLIKEMEGLRLTTGR